LSDYKRLLSRKVDYVFNKMTSLLTEVTFVLREGESFNFGTRKTEVESEENRTVKVFVLKTKQGLQSTRKELLLRDIPELDIYDRCLIGSEEWRFGQITYDDGFIKILEVVNG